MEPPINSKGTNSALYCKREPFFDESRLWKKTCTCMASDSIHHKYWEERWNSKKHVISWVSRCFFLVWNFEKQCQKVTAAILKSLHLARIILRLTGKCWKIPSPHTNSLSFLMFLRCSLWNHCNSTGHADGLHNSPQNPKRNATWGAAVEPWGPAWLFNVVHMYHENSSNKVR